MSREQIEEMARDMGEGKCMGCRTFDSCSACPCDYCCVFQENAEVLTQAGYRKQSEWISVEERLPEPNAHVLIYAFFHNQWQIVKGWLSFCDEKFYIVNSDYPSLTDIPVTHWMPLPEPPKMKGGAE